jgi:hypothetical protein
MSAFDAGVTALFADPHLAREVVYTPAGGDPVTVRAIRTAPDVTRDWGATAVHSDSVVYDLPVSAVAAPSAGDTITDGAETRVVQGVPERDDHRTVWTLDTRPA